MQKNLRIWDPSSGEACQGDIVIKAVDVVVSKDREIKPRSNHLIIAEGEATGHHHKIFAPMAFFRDDGLARDLTANLARKKTIGKAFMFADEIATEQLVRKGELLTVTLAIGYLFVEGAPVTLLHDEHDPIQIPVGGPYYVGAQREWDSSEERRVAD